MNGKKQFSRRVTVRMNEGEYWFIKAGRKPIAESVRGLIHKAMYEWCDASKGAEPEPRNDTTTLAMAYLIAGIFLGIVIACALIKTGVL